MVHPAEWQKGLGCRRLIIQDGSSLPSLLHLDGLPLDPILRLAIKRMQKRQVSVQAAYWKILAFLPAWLNLAPNVRPLRNKVSTRR